MPENKAMPTADQAKEEDMRAVKNWPVRMFVSQVKYQIEQVYNIMPVHVKAFRIQFSLIEKNLIVFLIENFLFCFYVAVCPSDTSLNYGGCQINF